MTRDRLQASAARPIRRVVVCGTPATGKTTFARQLAPLLDVPYLWIDELVRGRDRQGSVLDDEGIRAMVEPATRGPAWVMDGTHSAVIDLTWGRADTIVWLDCPLPLKLWWRVRRASGLIVGQRLPTFGEPRGVMGELKKLVRGHSSLPRVIRRHRGDRRTWPLHFEELGRGGAAVWHLKSPREAREFL